MDDTAYAIGEALALLKEAEAAPELSYDLHGELYFSQTGYLLLSVPNAMGRGAFDSLHVPGVELPVADNGRYNAHITVMYPEEVESIGGPGKITERGHAVSYTTGPVTSWESAKPGYGRVWALSVRSPELEKIRRSYGLSSWPKEDRPFHITFAVRRRNVLREGPVSKVRSIRQLLGYWDQDHGREVSKSAGHEKAGFGGWGGAGLGDPARSYGFFAPLARALPAPFGVNIGPGSLRHAISQASPPGNNTPGLKAMAPGWRNFSPAPQPALKPPPPPEAPAAAIKASSDSAETLKAIEEARKNTAEPKSPEQAAAGNYKKGKVVIHGLTIAIENPKGSTRKGVDKNGKPWSVEMKNDYGYILRAKT